jgi:hypothetical protein
VELSIVFDDAELAALCDLLGERIGRLGPSALDGLTAAVRSDRLASARVALFDRHVLVTTDGGETQVAVVVAKLVEILSRPLITVDIHMREPGAGWAPHASRLAAITEASVAHERVGGGNRLTPFATVDLLRRTASMSGLRSDITPAARSVTIDQRSLANALNASSDAHIRGEIESGIADDHKDMVDELVVALRGRGGAIDIRTKPEDGWSYGVQLAWIVGPSGAWELPTHVTPLEGGPGDLKSGVPVTLEPVSGTQLLGMLVSVAEERG